MKKVLTDFTDYFSTNRFSLLVDFIKIILVGVIGGLLTHYWHNQEYVFQNQFEQRKYEKEKATETLELNSKLIDNVILNFQLYTKGVVDKNACKQSFIEWKGNYSGQKALMEKYFGEEAVNSFNQIESQLNQLFQSLILLPDSPVPSDIQTTLNQLEMDVYRFNSILIEELLTDNIGSYMRKPK